MTLAIVTNKYGDQQQQLGDKHILESNVLKKNLTWAMY